MDPRARRPARRSIVTAMLALLLISIAPAFETAADDSALPDWATGTDETSKAKKQPEKQTRSERAAEVGEKTFDAVVLRPLQSLALVGGTVLFVPAAAMASPGGEPLILEAWDFFVVVRYEDAWTRSLGDF